MDTQGHLETELLNERRASGRFPIQQDVHYRILDSLPVNQSGKGKSVDISSVGIRFTTEARLLTGKLLEVSISWPAQLNGDCPLKLVALGRVVRTEGGVAAMRIEKYEFKTRGSLGANAVPQAATSRATALAQPVAS